MSPKIVLDQKKIWSRKSFGFENLGPKKFSFKDNLGQKIIWVPKNFGPKILTLSTFQTPFI